MPIYKVLGEENAEVEVLGTNRKVGDELELTAEEAAPAVEAGVLSEVTAA